MAEAQICVVCHLDIQPKEGRYNRLGAPYHVSCYERVGLRGAKKEREATRE